MVDLEVSVPPDLQGDPNHRIHVYLTLPGQDPALIQEAPIADAPRTVIPVQLTDGINDFTAKIAGPAGESDPSLAVRYVFDNVPPKITITSPKNNAIVNGKAVDIKGKTQARTTLLAHNAANGSSIAGTAESDGTFTLSLALSCGCQQDHHRWDRSGRQRQRGHPHRQAWRGQARRRAQRVRLPDQALAAARGR